MKKIFAIILILIFAGTALFFIYQNNNNSSASYKTITTEEGKKMIDEEEVKVVDVRTKEEYESGHIPGAILIPNETISENLPQELPDLKEKIVVYCRSGRRSDEAAKKLADLGYENIFDMGGLNDWPYEVVSGEEIKWIVTFA